MREIKFRAWDKEANIMVYSDHRTRKLYDVYYGFEMNGEGELECRWEGEFTESHVLDGGMLDNLMQYTGLKDKNDKEIYEGDICRWRDLETFNDEILEDVFVVVWNDEKLAWYAQNEDGDFGYDLYEYTDDYDLAVIGNIYEN